LQPHQSPESYYNRKGFHSIKIQAICDADGLFLDVFVGWPGRSHDSRAFFNSPIFRRLEGGLLEEDDFLLGDSAYPLKSYLMVPYKGETSGLKSVFNYELSRCRQIIECAFGRLVEKFRRLKYLQFPKLQTCILVCLVACALHNFCILNKDDSEEDHTASEHTFQIFDDSITGLRKRELLTTMMSS